MLDYFDAHDMWKDTALILTTDHGFLLGEHDWWAKNRMPLYEEISHIPLFVHHPAFADQAGTRRTALTQTIDLMPTFCELFGATIPPEVQGRRSCRSSRRTRPQRDAVIFGYWGGGINVDDGRYTWFCYPRDMKNQDLYQYTLMPAHMTKLFTVEEMQQRQPRPALRLDQGRAAAAHRPRLQGRPAHPQLPLPRGDGGHRPPSSTTSRPTPARSTRSATPAVEARLRAALFRIMAENDAPAEVVRRMEESVGAPA